MSGVLKSGSYGLFVAALGIAAAVLPVSAETWYLSAAGNDNNKAWWSEPGLWTNSQGAAASGFSIGDDYVVVAKTLRTKKENDINIWRGRSLSILGTSKSSRGVFRQNSPNDTFFTGEIGLVLGNYSSCNVYESEKMVAVSGRIAVAADSRDSAAVFDKKSHDTPAGFVFTGSFCGEAGSFAKVATTRAGFSLVFDDTSSYFGTFSVEDGTQLTLQLGGTSFPGTLELNSTTDLIVTNGIVIGNLSVADGTTISIGPNTLTVSGVFKHGDKPVPVTVDHLARAGNLRFVAGAAGAFALDDFEFFNANGARILSDDLVLEETEGGIAIRLKKPRVTIWTSDHVGVSTAANQESPSSLNDASKWTDGHVPGPGKDYFLGFPGCTSETGIRTPYGNDHLGFEGDSLALYDGGVLMLMCDSFLCNLHVAGSGGMKPRLSSSIGKEVALKGTLTMESGTLSVCTLRGGLTRIDSEISGSGALEFFQATGANSTSPRGQYYLASTNEAFRGSVRVYSVYYNHENPDKITPRFDRNYVYFYLNDARALGGPLDAVNRKSFSIEDMSCVFLRDSAALDFSEPTRGIYIGYHGRFRPNAGESVRISSPLAVYGTLWKEGAGMMTLANPAPTFGADANSEMPDPDATNRMFRVSGGDVRIAAVDAVNGLDVVFTNGAGRILYDILSAEGDMAEFGIRNVKTVSPFAVDGDLSQIDLVLDSTAELPPFVSNGVFTVKTEAYETAANVLNIVRGGTLAGRRMSFVRRENGDDTTTLVVTRQTCGTTIVVR